MKPEIKKLWVEALRSGEYTQTQNFLHDNQGMCCLGVLCDLHRKETDGPDWKPIRNHPRGIHEYLTNEATLPKEVKEWAGLEKDVPEVGDIADMEDVTVAGLNDGTFMNRQYETTKFEPYTFKQIADVIEERL